MRPRELSRAIALFAARTPTLPPATHTNSYALGAREVLLVEPATPYEDEQRAWIAWARALAVGGAARRSRSSRRTTTPITSAALDVLARELGLPVWAHARDGRRASTCRSRGALDDGDEHRPRRRRRPSAGACSTRRGTRRGTSASSTTRARTLVVGDMVASVGTILIAPGDGDMRVYLEQLERLAALDARLALPAHGEPIDEPTALFRRYIAHRADARGEGARRARARERARGGDAPRSSCPIAYDDVPPAHSGRSRCSACAAHLEKLVPRGARAATRDGRCALQC